MLDGLGDVRKMTGKAFLRAVFICLGISGFIMVSLGIVLLVLVYPLVFVTTGLVVLGTAQLVAFCCPRQEKRVLASVILLDLGMIFMMISGLVSYLEAGPLTRAAGLLCFFLGLLVNAALNALLAIWITLDAGCEKQDFCDKKTDGHLNAVIRAKRPKYRFRIRG